MAVAVVPADQVVEVVGGKAILLHPQNQVEEAVIAAVVGKVILLLPQRQNQVEQRRLHRQNRQHPRFPAVAEKVIQVVLLLSQVRHK